ncbi:hypothetical protein E2C01_037707 [Portunus trituberculatus]|uniref:Uncharacterized protein n=1 Tax=Portunus trituberculatus TaxID=210409 RepID=A0A5B7FGI9_PORTR|nr:hypothetical protein [Portunus trituberculatus]
MKPPMTPTPAPATTHPRGDTLPSSRDITPESRTLLCKQQVVFMALGQWFLTFFGSDPKSCTNQPLRPKPT